MNFWNRVLTIIESKDINKKTLASSVGIDPSTISKGLSEGNLPNAETAVRIAQFLGTTVEYLVTGKEPVFASDNVNLDILYKYSATIQALNEIPEVNRKTIETMIFGMRDSFINILPANPDATYDNLSHHNKR